MLHDDGTFAFREEILEAVDAVVQAYERHIDADQTDLERELLITFLLGRICYELDVIREAMASSPTLEGLDPQNIYEKCVTENAAEKRRQVSTVTKLLLERGWIAAPQSESAT
ncbi:MAG: hypothetical protein ACP5G7_09085 [Anaerolineae bacterium]